jgi:hypothetical protein
MWDNCPDNGFITVLLILCFGKTDFTFWGGNAMVEQQKRDYGNQN